ncbi:uncharacterized protein LOC125676015 [Ostrea edulis]|uniref:uncharacterized protein LOC125676015 n=1 Tax=Ostrea edulis TaxID=37623 RepID=UPI0020965FE5|nr:uncharacterized protein LOC125676015 [Ostrea edulis]
MGVYPGTSMAIRGNKELYFIWVLISSTELVHGYSACSSEAEAASLPAALLCYDNQVSAGRVVLDGYLAKESNTANCRCTVTSNATGVLNISNYNGNHPEAHCGSSLLFEAGGVSFPMNCFVSNIQLSDAGSGASVSLGNPQLADNTDYCISIQSGNSAAVLNVTCWGDPLPSTSTTEFPLTTEEIEASSSSPTTSGHPTITNTPNHTSFTKEDISNTSTTASWNFSTSTQSSATTNEPVTYSHSSTFLPRSSQTMPTSSEASPRTDQKNTQTFSTGVTSSSTSPSTSSSDVSLITTFSTMTSAIDQTTLSDTTTDETLTVSSDSTPVPLQTPETGTSTDALSTTTTEVSMQTMTTISTPASTSTQTPSTSGDQNATSFSSTSKTNTMTVSAPQADRGTQWSLIIPAILLGIILFFALMFAFIKWKRSLEIKYPSEDHAPLHYNTPGGHTNIGYDAFDEGPEIITEFTKSPENRELDSIVLENVTENEPEPNNQMKGAFIRYDVKDYRKGRNSPDKTVVKREPNGPDVYF